MERNKNVREAESTFETTSTDHFAAGDRRPPSGHERGPTQVIPDCRASPLSAHFRGHIAAIDKGPGKWVFATPHSKTDTVKVSFHM